MVDSMMEEAQSKDASIANISSNSEALNDLWQRIRYFLNGKDD